MFRLVRAFWTQKAAPLRTRVRRRRRWSFATMAEVDWLWDNCAVCGIILSWTICTNLTSPDRAICSIYVYLGALGVAFQTVNCSWNVDISDCFLPCEESERMSISPQAWSETRKSSFKPLIRFSVAMAKIFSSQWALASTEHFCVLFDFAWHR